MPFALAFSLAACDPAPPAPSKPAPIASASTPEQDMDWLERQCATGSDAGYITAFTKRVLAEFSSPIACSANIEGRGDNGPYGTVTMRFADAHMIIQTDMIGGLVQSVEILPETNRTQDWFTPHRDDFANGYGPYMNWSEDTDPAPLVAQYWATDIANIQVQLTLREDESISQIRFSDPS